ncbi:tripeptide aminopeptidase [Anaerobacterium chartisolvens]|uniref:Tripeptide aminopeptidase n=1 Tax=Anaerobacterium chartisolvens TaxID=1297424 RepID=A0A369B0N1_9FIRM|nr:M20/M25/M40 family metallo-hydrolase [Anaerobacterium chartisolvens]RCX13244.1 tripeptide aminopeptidase [Anaerobacterium chartisolvens]
MVNASRMRDEFLELVRIDSVTLHERRMADVLKAKLESMGIPVYEDNAGEKIGGNAGNLICTVKGERDVPGILLMAHMDTVSPGIGKNPVVEGDIIRTDGTTVLGGDDAAGIECILEALRVISEDGIPHGNIHIAFTVAEEGGLLGAKNMDYGAIDVRYGFVMDDGGDIGSVAVSAPTQNKIDIIVKGKAAHAGVEPEKGISAIQIAAWAISQMRLGRIDHETTANIGIIKGGCATNIICDRVEIEAEARSRSRRKLDEQTSHMRHCFETACARFGGSFKFDVQNVYPEFNVKQDSGIMRILERAAKKAEIELKAGATGGGSDTNIINGRGIEAVDISVGMDKVHSVEEQISIKDMARAAEFLVEIIKAI